MMKVAAVREDSKSTAKKSKQKPSWIRMVRVETEKSRWTEEIGGGKFNKT